MQPSSSPVFLSLQVLSALLLSNDSGIVTNAKTDEFRDWFRTTIHRIIRHALQPIERFMRGGTIMLCADGKKRLCFPILCQYISDMEEQWLLTNQVKPACPKCPKRTRRLYGSPNETLTAAGVPVAPSSNRRQQTAKRSRPSSSNFNGNGRVAKQQIKSTAGGKRGASGSERGKINHRSNRPEVSADGLEANGGNRSPMESDSEDDSESEDVTEDDELDAPQPPVSTKPGSKLPTFDSAEALTAQQTGRKRITERRTDIDAEVWRDGHDRGIYSFQQLRQAGYHRQRPFSARYPYGGILDAVGPDLLHQVTKCFMDYLFNSWIYPLMLSHAKKQFRKIQLEVDVEIDARFALVPSWTGMRWFREGIISQTHPWTCHEMKDMMRQTIGCLVGLCPPEGISLIRDYLHIHRLSHYTVHTDESLAWLEDAVITFSNHLRAPAGPFARTMYNSGDCEPQRLHYFRHYAQSVREKGALPSYSTDRTEIWHKWLKESWERSNKGEDSMEYILREHTRRNAFQEMLDTFATGDRESNNTNSDSGAAGKRLAAGEEVPPEDDEEEEISLSRKDDPTITWPKSPRKLWRAVQADQTELLLQLPGFQLAVTHYFRKLNLPLVSDNIDADSHRNPRIRVYNSIKVGYPGWVSHEVVSSEATRAATSPSNDFMSRRPVEYVPPSQRQVQYDRLYASSLRHNTVLVRRPDIQVRGPWNTMNYRRVAQLLLLFKCEWRHQEHELAYVSWFETKRAADPNSGLYLVGRTKKCTVIDVKDIERGVHLIPKFGAQVGETAKLQRKLELQKAQWRLQVNIGEMDKREKARLEVINERDWSALAHYTDFWLNSWIDSHSYKTIY